MAYQNGLVLSGRHAHHAKANQTVARLGRGSSWLMHMTLYRHRVRCGTRPGMCLSFMSFMSSMFLKLSFEILKGLMLYRPTFMLQALLCSTTSPLIYNFYARHHRSGQPPQQYSYSSFKTWSLPTMGCIHGKSNQVQWEEGQVPQTQRARSASGHDDRTWRLLALSISSSQSTFTCMDTAPPSLRRKAGLPPSSANASSLPSLSLRSGLTSTSLPHSSDPTADAD